MVVDHWKIEKGPGRCVKSNVEIREGDPYYAVLFEDGESFRREDYAIDAWQGQPEGAYCFFKTKMPIKEKKKKLLIDDDMLVEFFKRLGSETQPTKLQFRFVLALILMRKRILKYDETECDGDREYWLMRLRKEEKPRRVLNPKLTDDEIEGVSTQLGAILHGDMGDFTTHDSENDASTHDPSDHNAPDQNASTENPSSNQTQEPADCPALTQDDGAHA
jgi:hypothetical protein